MGGKFSQTHIGGDERENPPTTARLRGGEKWGEIGVKYKYDSNGNDPFLNGGDTRDRNYSPDIKILSTTLYRIPAALVPWHHTGRIENDRGSKMLIRLIPRQRLHLWSQHVSGNTQGYGMGGYPQFSVPGLSYHIIPYHIILARGE